MNDPALFIVALQQAAKKAEQALADRDDWTLASELQKAIDAARGAIACVLHDRPCEPGDD